MYERIISSTLSFIRVLDVSTTPTSITLDWSEAATVEQMNVMIRWERTNLCSFETTTTMSTNTTMSSITIAELEEYSSYNVTVSIGNTLKSDSLFVMTNESAPSAAPSDLTFLSATSSSITLQWKAVPCIHQNGNITGYIIVYGEVNAVQRTLSKSIVRGLKETTTGSITGLRPLTHYNISVAAVNSAGIGPFTNSFMISIYPDYSSGSTVIIVGVVCSLVFLSVGVLLGAVGPNLVQRVRSKLSPSPPPVPLAVTYEEVDVSKEGLEEREKTQLNTNEAHALRENIPTSHNTAYGQVQF